MKSHLWLVILVIIALLLCILVKSPDPIKESSAEVKVPATQVESEDPVKESSDKVSLYDKLDADVDTAVEQLRKKYVRAKNIVPLFPEFPQLWLLPPPDKGSYGSLGERYTVEFLELLFPGHTFIKAKHPWMRSRKNYPLELDGYCEELMLAVEYNGYQHYVFPNRFHKTLKEFFEQRERDQIKVESCIARHICLIRIPYTVPTKRIPLAIYSKLLEAVPGLE